jgi:aspartate aminotransferase-like enzyme
MEAALVSLLEPGEDAVVLEAGKFGERWRRMALAHGVVPSPVRCEWGRAVDPQQLREALRDRPGTRAVFVQAVESSTGVLHPIEQLARVTHDAGALLVVDAVSALGALPLPMDAWNIDVLIGAGHKALGLPPGLAFVAASERAWARTESAGLSRYYFDLRRERERQRDGQTMWTAPVSLVEGLDESLALLREEGLENVYARCALVGRAARAGMNALGFETFAQVPAPSITCVRAPESLDTDRLVRLIQERHGMRLAGGQERLKGRTLRLTHFGYLDGFDLLIAVAAIERGLRELGIPSELGAGLSAVQRVLAEADRPPVAKDAPPTPKSAVAESQG